MDLTRFEFWKRDALEKTARELGIRDPEYMTRRTLLKSIRDQLRGPRGPLRKAAKSMVSRIAGLARAFTGDEPQPAETDGEPTIREEPSAVVLPAAEEPVEPFERVVSKELVNTEAPPRSDSETPTHAEKPVHAKEPVETRTLARILREQGHHQRALSMYRRLLLEHEDDPELKHWVDRLSQDAAQGTGQPLRAESLPGESLRGEECIGNEVVSVTVDPSTLLVSWSVTEQSIERAQARLGSSGELTARVVVVAPEEDSIVGSFTHSTRAEREGEWVVSDLPLGARAAAAVGIADQHRFISVAHAPVLCVKQV